MTNQQQEFDQRFKEEQKDKLAEARDQISTFEQFLESLEVPTTGIRYDYYHPATGITATRDNLLGTIAPEIEYCKDGLVDVAVVLAQFKMYPFSPANFRCENYICFANRFFRRAYSYHNNYAPHFLGYFLNYARNSVNSTRIALDMNRVRIDVNGGTYEERDTWYGAPFNQEIRNIPDGNIKLVTPPEFNEHNLSMFCASVISLFIRWSTKGNIKTFYAEAFKTSNVLVEFGEDILHPTRYIHAEYDLEQGVFIHMDGAIHLYDDAEYEARLYSNINHNDKSKFQIKGQSKKLFRIDGIIEEKDWSNLCCHFMTKNPLMIEYFSGSLPEHVVRVRTRLQKES